MTGCSGAYDNASTGKSNLSNNAPAPHPSTSVADSSNKPSVPQNNPAVENNAIPKAIEIDPLDSDAYFKLGQSERQSKKFEQAMADLNKAIELRPEHFDAHMSLAHVYAELRRHKESLQEYTKATELRPKSSDAWEGRAWILNELQQYSQAAEAANKAIELNPKMTGNAREFLAGSYNALHKYDLALKACNEGIKLKPKSDWLIEMRADAEEHLDELPAAIKDYKKAIEMNPKAWNWLYPGLVSCYDRYLKEKDLN
jgi:superkiller protein 3